MVICLERSADLHTAQLMPLPLTVSCFGKIQIGFSFLVLAHLGSPRKRAVKRVCVCVWLNNSNKWWWQVRPVLLLMYLAFAVLWISGCWHMLVIPLNVYVFSGSRCVVWVKCDWLSDWLIDWLIDQFFHSLIETTTVQWWERRFRRIPNQVWEGMYCIWDKTRILVHSAG